MPPPPFGIETLNWATTEYDPAHPIQQTVERTNWDALCQLASELNHGLSCILLDKSTNGLYNLVRLIQFSDQTRWIVRIPLRRSAADSVELQREVDTMYLVRDRSQIPVPQIFAYEVDGDNPVGVPFVLMEFLPGNTAVDSAGGWEVHKGQVPLAYRDGFYRSVAEYHVQMTAIRLSKIGTIIRTANGEYGIGPLPDIGGPFDTATAFFEAWAEKAIFPYGKDKILQMMGGGPAQQVLDAIYEFPSQIKSLASELSSSTNNRGPFPLVHGDFYYSNIIVDDNFKTIGIIDWAGSCTLPWELVTFPAFLRSMPPSFGSPENYDANTMPLDPEERQRLKEQQDYVHMVQSAERNDNALSTCLKDTKRLGLSYAIMSYETGKLGFYDRVLDEWTRA
ncbi:kinase-like domain-containing protein [Xylariaceae sp. FL1272]|nr:kinase-like domain-containing protein [Xylariaceae sp. FL1272]